MENNRIVALYEEARLEQLRQILGDVRAGPLSYESERPNNRPTPPRDSQSTD